MMEKNYEFGTIISAYRDFEDRTELVAEKTSSLDAVRRAADNKIGKFTKSYILEQCPALSPATVERCLRKLCEEDEISMNGQGRSTYCLRRQ